MLRGLDEDQLNEVFDTLFSSARGRDDGVPAHARTEETAPRTPPAPSKDELKEFFDPASEKFDPMAAITGIVERNYGGLLGDINMRSLGALSAQLKGQFPDFDEYSQDVNRILAATGKAPAAMSSQDLLAAYYMAKGARTTEKETKERTKPPTTRTPSPGVNDEEPDSKDTKLSDDEIQAAKIMFRNSADPIAEFRKAEKQAREFKMKIPGDK